MTAVAIQYRDEIIAELAKGVDLRIIAPRLDVTPAAISQYLSHDPEYVQAREIGMAQKIEACEQEVESATTPLNLARARERFRIVSWRAEREFPHRWGQRTQVDVTVDLGATIQQSADRMAVAQ